MSFKHQPKLGESDVVKKSCEVEERNCIADQVDAEAAKMPAEVPLEAERGHPPPSPSLTREAFDTFAGNA